MNETMIPQPAIVCQQPTSAVNDVVTDAAVVSDDTDRQLSVQGRIAAGRHMLGGDKYGPRPPAPARKYVSKISGLPYESVQEIDEDDVELAPEQRAVDAWEDQLADHARTLVELLGSNPIVVDLLTERGLSREDAQKSRDSALARREEESHLRQVAEAAGGGTIADQIASKGTAPRTLWLAAERPGPKAPGGITARIAAGGLAPTAALIHFILQYKKAPGVDIRLDNFQGQLMWMPRAGDPDSGYSGEDGTARPFRDTDYTRLKIRLEERLQISPIAGDVMRGVVALVGQENIFDGAVDWLTGLPDWDGTKRVASFLAEYAHAAAGPYATAVSLYMWTALAGRVMQAGCKADMVPVLIGRQGARKSTLVSRMAPDRDRFTALSLATIDADAARRMRGKLVIELEELKGLGQREKADLKAFLSRTTDEWVEKYEQFQTSRGRRCLFIGTTNQETFLEDETGERRWLPVTICTAGDEQFCEVDRLEADRDQLWAEALHLWKHSGVAYVAAEKLGADAVLDHKVQDSWSEKVAKWLAEKADRQAAAGEEHLVATTDILEDALLIQPRDQDKVKLVRLVAILRGLSYVRMKVRVGKATVWRFGKPAAVS